MNIMGRVIKLRAVEEHDLGQLHEWANNPDLWYLLGGWHFPGSMETTRKWFLSLDSDGINKRFAIETISDALLVGTAHLTDIDWKNNHAAFGFMIGEKGQRGRGFGKDISMAVFRYVFEELHFERLEAHMIEYNDTSIRHAKFCGWKDEGRLRRWFFRKGRYWDKVVLGITKDDYDGLPDRQTYWEE